MARRRAQLVHISTQQPVDPNWTPLIETGEIEEANARMAANRLQWRWRWLPATVLLTGSVELHADDPIPCRAAL